jgi:hypothetical protein
MDVDPSYSLAAEHELSAPDIPAARAVTGSSTANTARFPFAPIACWQISDFDFDFDSPFVDLTAVGAFQKVADLHAKLRIRYKAIYDGKPLMILFGHADPVGREDYNKRLSENRAKAIYAVLTRKPELWLELFPKGRKRNHLCQKLIDVGYDKGDVSRRLLDVLSDYMNYLCKDSKGEDFRLADDYFIGGAKLAFRGCSEFNPLRVLAESEEENSASGKRLRNAANRVNRRVVALFFKPGTTSAAAEFPCRPAPDIQACLDSFFPDGKDRLKAGPNRREHAPGGRERTFACMFYSRLAVNSPCEVLREHMIEPKIAFVGDEPYFWDLECFEVNAKGTVGSYNALELEDGHSEDRDKYEHNAKTDSLADGASREWRAGMTPAEYVREYRSWIMALVEIHWTASPRQMTARVYARATGKNLFDPISVAASPVLVKRWYYCSSPSKGRTKVWRRVPLGQKPPDGFVRREVEEPEDYEEIAKRLYNLLRFGYDNITERASNILLSAAAAEGP